MWPLLKMFVVRTEKSPPDSENYKKSKSRLSNPLLLVQLEFNLFVVLNKFVLLVKYYVTKFVLKVKFI